MKLLAGFILGVLILAAIAAGIAYTGRFPFWANAKPPQWERRLANLALDPAVERKAAGLECPIPATDANLTRGMQLYRDHCAECHGDRGKPSHWGRNDFYPPAPQLADRGDHDPVPEIFVVVKNGIRYTGMGGWEGEASDDDLWRVALFLSKIKSLPPAVDAAWKKAK